MALGRKPPDQSGAPESLRGATDRNALRDKVAVIDPAAAPLETDAEATATATPRAAQQAAVDDQKRLAARRGAPAAPFASRLQPGQRRTPGAWTVAAILVMVGTGSLAGALSLQGIDRSTPAADLQAQDPTAR